MSEIEKMYDNAEVDKCNSRLKEIMPNICLKNNNDENYKCEDCEYYDYPEFTAEKQLVLMRYIALNDNIDYVKYYYQAIKGVWVFVCVTVTELASEVPKVYGAYHEEFEQALAGLINDLWQDLTETEKAEIKEILE